MADGLSAADIQDILESHSRGTIAIEMICRDNGLRWPTDDEIDTEIRARMGLDDEDEGADP
ncbi:hypothetical protein GCM10027088_01140 [Nocardia goodfellowii]|uniref:Uncharacterized protein n=1 Tax=Nocardia goodfellowii TaxID=882446 RepID=A0ABS4QHB1_9NOCA|nr:hypothetical protein [Nocardia goodfellowii]